MTGLTQMNPEIRRPANVPAELVRDLDFFTIEPIEGDLHLGWHTLHNGPDIFWSPRNGGHWVFTRAEDIQFAYRETDKFSSKINNLPFVDTGFRFAPAQFDPPELGAYRNALASAFTPKALAGYEVIVRALSNDLITGFATDGECEFQSAVAQHLPIGVFLGMMGFPGEDAGLLLPLVEEQIRNPNPSAVQASMNAMIAYLAEKIEDRRRNPADDLTSHVIASTIDGRPATQQEVFSMCINLMFAGLDTVVAQLGFSMRFLAMHPEHQQQLIDEPDLIPDAVEELMRYHGITNLARVVRADMTYKNVTLRADDLVLLSTTLFGLDERRFPDPTRIDFRREDKAHMNFGSGPHRCLGSHLARLELKIFLAEWFKRIGKFSLSPSAAAVPVSGKVNAMRRLPLRWAPSSSRVSNDGQQ